MSDDRAGTVACGGVADDSGPARCAWEAPSRHRDADAGLRGDVLWPADLERHRRLGVEVRRRSSGVGGITGICARGSAVCSDRLPAVPRAGPAGLRRRRRPVGGGRPRRPPARRGIAGGSGPRRQDAARQRHAGRAGGAPAVRLQPSAGGDAGATAGGRQDERDPGGPGADQPAGRGGTGADDGRSAYAAGDRSGNRGRWRRLRDGGEGESAAPLPGHRHGVRLPPPWPIPPGGRQPPPTMATGGRNGG